MPDQDDGKILDPIFMPLFTLLWEFAGCYLAKTGKPISMIDAMDIAAKHLKTCPSSPMSAANLEFIEIIDDLQE
jgi:hypothetical protein